MKSKKERGYWVKRAERFVDAAAAKERAGNLRQDEHVAHVKVDKQRGEYVVSYSVPAWYLEEL